MLKQILVFTDCIHERQLLTTCRIVIPSCTARAYFLHLNSFDGPEYSTQNDKNS